MGFWSKLFLGDYRISTQTALDCAQKSHGILIGLSEFAKILTELTTHLKYFVSSQAHTITQILIFYSRPVSVYHSGESTTDLPSQTELGEPSSVRTMSITKQIDWNGREICLSRQSCITTREPSISSLFPFPFYCHSHVKDAGSINKQKIL